MRKILFGILGISIASISNGLTLSDAIPTGQYKSVCKNVTYNGETVSANCSSGKQNLQLSLNYKSLCNYNSAVSLKGNKLVCDLPRAYPLPAGDYLKTCVITDFDNKTLKGVCKNSTSGANLAFWEKSASIHQISGSASSLLVSNCDTVGNVSGKLSCLTPKTSNSLDNIEIDDVIDGDINGNSNTQNVINVKNNNTVANSKTDIIVDVVDSSPDLKVLTPSIVVRAHNPKGQIKFNILSPQTDPVLLKRLLAANDNSLDGPSYVKLEFKSVSNQKEKRTKIVKVYPNYLIRINNIKFTGSVYSESDGVYKNAYNYCTSQINLINDGKKSITSLPDYCYYGVNKKTVYLEGVGALTWERPMIISVPPGGLHGYNRGLVVVAGVGQVFAVAAIATSVIYLGHEINRWFDNASENDNDEFKLDKPYIRSYGDLQKLILPMKGIGLQLSKASFSVPNEVVFVRVNPERIAKSDSKRYDKCFWGACAKSLTTTDFHAVTLQEDGNLEDPLTANYKLTFWSANPGRVIKVQKVDLKQWSWDYVNNKEVPQFKHLRPFHFLTKCTSKDYCPTTDKPLQKGDILFGGAGHMGLPAHNVGYLPLRYVLGVVHSVIGEKSKVTVKYSYFKILPGGKLGGFTDSDAEISTPELSALSQ